MAFGAIATAVGATLAPVGVESSPVSVVLMLLRQDARLTAIGERLIVGAAQLCRPGDYSLGIALQTLAQYGAAYRQAARDAGIGTYPSIAAVAPGSAAAQAGLAIGDQIVGVDGQPFAVARAERSRGSYVQVDAALSDLERGLANGVVRLQIARADRTMGVTVHARTACRARFDVRAGKHHNATSDGTYVHVSSDIVAALNDDAQLAAVMAHELAHNVLRHPQRRRAKESGLTERSTEIDADRLSVYLLDAAGFPPGAAVDFWLGWGRRHDAGLFADSSHPRWKQRVAAITAELRLVQAQRDAGRPVHVPPELAAR